MASTPADDDAAWEEIAAGVDCLFLSPEQLADETVVQRVLDAGVSLLVVDETHGVSGWRHHPTRRRSRGPKHRRALEESAQQRERIGRSRLAMMRNHAETRDCRRGFLLGCFGDELAALRGGCDSCDGGIEAESELCTDAGPLLAGAAVEHSEWGPGSVMSVDGDRLTARFDHEGYRRLGTPTIAERNLLTVVEPGPGAPREAASAAAEEGELVGSSNAA